MTYINQSRVSQTVLPHVFIDVASRDEISLDIPYRHWKSHLTVTDRNNADFLGYVYLRVFNALKTGAGTTEGAVINVSVEFTNAEFVIPSVNPVGGLQLQGNSLVKTTNINIERVTDSTMGPMASSDGFEGRNDVSPTIAASVPLGDGDSSATASSTPKPRSGGKQKRKANDKPRIGTNLPQWVSRPMPYMSHAQQVEFTDYMSYMPGETDAHSPDSLCVKRDEMSDDYLLEMSTYDETIEWTKDNDYGSILWSDDLCPFSKAFTFSPPGELDVTLLDFRTCRSTFWRGSLVYEFDIVASDIHSGQLAFCVNYGVFSDPVDLNLAMAQYVAVFDLAPESKKFRVVVPYRSTREYMYVPNGSPDRIEDYSLGRVSLRVINNLRVMDSIADSVEVNVFRAGGTDYEVSKPSSVNSSWTLELQGADDPIAEVQEGEVPEVTPATGGTAIADPQSVMPSYLTSVKDQMKRYFRLGEIDEDVGFAHFDVAEIFNATNENGPSWSGINFSKPGLIAWYSSLYRYYSGSLRFMVVYEGDDQVKAPIVINWTMRPLVDINTDSIFNSVSDYGSVEPFDVTYSKQHFAAVEVPFTTINPFVLMRSTITRGSKYSGTVVIQKDPTLKATLLVSLGDQTRMACLYKVPRLKMTANHTPDTYGPPGFLFIGSAISIVHQDGAPEFDAALFSDVVQLDVFGTSIGGPHPCGELRPNNIVYATQDLTPQMLTYLGFPADDSTSIVILPGETETSQRDLSTVAVIPNSRVYRYVSGSANNFGSERNRFGSGEGTTNGPMDGNTCIGNITFFDGTVRSGQPYESILNSQENNVLVEFYANSPDVVWADNFIYQGTEYNLQGEAP